MSDVCFIEYEGGDDEAAEAGWEKEKGFFLYDARKNKEAADEMLEGV